ncbi:hypothetical protein JTB14_034251 [Gonioctena quinquepunctata]|nr:hypothetical protein JTB14_034251 [Gonioctena quinquepunctata]
MRASDQTLNQSQRLQQFLFSYRNTVRRSTKRTPSQLMFGRHLRSRFDLLKPDVMKNIEYEQFVQKQHHDSTAAPDQNFIEGEEVWVNNPLSKGSLPGKIVKRTGPLSYLVEIDGILRRKHCDQMRKRKLMINTNEPSHQDMSDEFEDYQSPQLHQSASCNENESSLNEVEAEEGELNNVDHSLSRECVIPRRNPFRIRKPPSRFSE